ncbi:unnamed protein product [Calypogeia fissa]
MSTGVQSVEDTLNVKKNVGENPVKRTIAKLRHPMRALISDSAAESTLDQSQDQNQEPHVATGEYATSASHAVIKEAAEYMQSPEGETALTKISICLARVVRENAVSLLKSTELKETFRMNGRETVYGAWQTLEEKLGAGLEKLPKVVTVAILPVSAVFVGLFMLGLLLALWRFALFGLS